MKVIISGGGIAGLSLAAVFARRGHSVRVFERSRGAALGAGVVCFPNATLVLRHLGLEERLRAVAGVPLTMRRVSHNGEALGELPISVINELMGAPSYSVLRADLHRLLLDFAKESGAEVETSCRVLRASGQGTLHLSDGRTVDADWVIGADGRMDSPLRRFVTGSNHPRYGGFVNWIGVAQSEEEVFDPHVVYDHWGLGERFGVVPITARLAYFAGGALAPLAQPSQEALLPRLKKRFASWPRPVLDALEAARPESLREIYVHDHDPIEVWHREKVLLVGDAAHAPLPTSGQGACQALEDAFHMAQMLDEGGPLDPQGFFARFTELRRKKTDAIVGSGRGFAKVVFNDDPSFVSARNRESKSADLSAAAGNMARLWSAGLSSPATM